jgi:hypothetical protein
MKYITGIHALNLTCGLDTCGDWHQSALAWKDIDIRDTKDSLLGEWGLEYNKSIPEHDGNYTVANHIRACIDLLESGNFSEVQGMHNDFICNEFYNNLIFQKVSELKILPLWAKIDEFMGREYNMRWLRFKEGLSDDSR